MHLSPLELQWKCCLLEIIVTVLWFALYLLISALISCLYISMLVVFGHVLSPTLSIFCPFFFPL